MLIIGIAGGTGSGKTTVVNKIMKDLNADDVVVISQDNYYRKNDHLSFEERTKINFDHPNSIDFDLLVKHLSQLKKGKTIEQPVYSFITHNRTKDTLITHPRDVIIVEGILVFTNPELLKMFDIKVYVYADPDERLIRRIRRDVSERGRDVEEVLSRYQQTLKPMHEQFIRPTMQYADIIIPNDRHNNVAVDIVRTVIKNKLNKAH